MSSCGRRRKVNSMNIIPDNLTPTNSKILETGFLVLLLVLVVIQFLLFYFLLPGFAGSFNRQPEDTVAQATEVKI